MILEKNARYTSFKLTRAAAGAAARADEGLIEQLCRLQTLYRGGMRQLCAQLEFIDDQFRDGSSLFDFLFLSCYGY